MLWERTLRIRGKFGPSVAHYRKNRVMAKPTLDGQIGVVIWIIVRDRNAGTLIATVVLSR
jgi:hypothetical protein